MTQPAKMRQTMIVKSKHDFVATQGGGYAYFDTETKQNVFIQIPTGDCGFKVGDAVPQDWGLTDALGVATFYESGGKLMSFFKGEGICPCCREYVERCKCKKNNN